MRFRRKPVEVDAVQYTEYGKLVTGMCNSRSCYASGNNEPHVHTIHDGQIVNLGVGDWIIPEPDGEHFYPCKPDIFAETYYPVVELKPAHRLGKENTIIRKLRYDHNMTQQQLVAAIGLPKSHTVLSEAENFYKPTNALFRRKLAEFFGVKESELFDEQGFAREAEAE